MTQHLGVTQDRVQWGAQFMRYRRKKLVFEPIRPLRLRAGCAFAGKEGVAFLFGKFLLRDVPRRPEHSDGITALVVVDLAPRRQPAGFAAVTHHAKVDVVGATIFDCGLNRLTDPLSVFGMDDMLKVFDGSVKGLRCQAVKLVDTLRPCDVIRADVPVPCARVTGVESEAQPLLAFAQALLQLLAVGDVHHDAHDRARLSFFILQYACTDIDPDDRAVLADITLLHRILVAMDCGL